jgi:hypothetical protein
VVPRGRNEYVGSCGVPSRVGNAMPTSMIKLDVIEHAQDILIAIPRCFDSLLCMPASVRKTLSYYRKTQRHDN